jgi:hypothetical protein
MWSWKRLLMRGVCSIVVEFFVADVILFWSRIDPGICDTESHWFKPFPFGIGDVSFELTSFVVSLDVKNVPFEPAMEELGEYLHTFPC